MSEDLLPILLCVVLPIAVVLIRSLTKVHADNKRTQIMLKAIESNNSIDTDKIAEAFRKPVKTAREILNARLLRGCIYTLVGVVIIAVGLANLCTGSDFSADPVTLPLLGGGASLAVGASYLIVYFVTRKEVAE